MSTQLPTLGTAINFNGTQLPVYGWSVEVGTFGQIGHASIHTTGTALVRAGVLLGPLTQGNNVRVPVQIQCNGEIIFTGVYFAGFPMFGEDEVEITVRDYTSILFDIKRSLASLDYKNQKVVTILAQIAKIAQLSINVSISSQNNIFLGALTDQENVMANQVDTLWNLVVFLARLTNSSVYCTPDGTIVFTDSVNSGTVHNYYWKNKFRSNSLTAGPESDSPPLKDLSAIHQPARNQNFSVMVFSHHQQTTETSISTVTMAGENIAVSSQHTVQKGFYTGVAAGQVKGLLSARGLGVPIYEFHAKDGMKPEEVQAMAEAYARDIAQHLIVATAIAPGNVKIRPNDRLNIQSKFTEDVLGLDFSNLFIKSVTHTWHMHNGDGVGNVGYLTTMKALNSTDPGGSSIDELANMGTP